MERPAPTTHRGSATLLLAAMVTVLLAVMVTLLSTPRAGADGDAPAGETADVEHVAIAVGQATLHAGHRGLLHPPPLSAAVLPDTVAPAAPGVVGSPRWPSAEAPVPAPTPTRWGRAPPAVNTAH